MRVCGVWKFTRDAVTKKFHGSKEPRPKMKTMMAVACPLVNTREQLVSKTQLLYKGLGS